MITKRTRTVIMNILASEVSEMQCSLSWEQFRSPLKIGLLLEYGSVGFNHLRTYRSR